MESNNSMMLMIWHPYVPALAITSCSLSVIGSIAIILSYLIWKSSRTISRLILVFVAFSDLLTSSGYILGSALYLQMYWQTNRSSLHRSIVTLPLKETHPFDTLCTVQSVITTISNMWSFWWMAILAVHLYMTVGSLQYVQSRKLLPYMAAVATVVPLAVTLPAMATGWLGVGNGTASVCWCFVKLKADGTTFYDLLEFTEGKLWEFLSFLIIFILLCHLKCKLKRYRTPSEETYLLNTAMRGVPRHTENKLLAFPILFFFIRFWGTLRYLLSLTYVFARHTAVMDFVSVYLIYSPFLVSMQAIFDGSQGWVNALLFVILSKEGLTRIEQVFSKLKGLRLFSSRLFSPCRNSAANSGLDVSVCHEPKSEEVDISGRHESTLQLIQSQEIAT